MEPRTEKEINQEYTDICTRLGDAVMKAENLKLAALDLMKENEQRQEMEKTSQLIKGVAQ